MTGRMILTTALLGTAALSAGCTPQSLRNFNSEAGAWLDEGEFGNATMQNHLAMTCRRVTPYNIGKYGQPLRSGCPGRLQDGKYALFAYSETITSATEPHELVIIDEEGSSEER